jgi:bacteriocin-like protein
MERITELKFQKLEKKEMKAINGGGIFPKTTEHQSEVSCIEGNTCYYTWTTHTGWFSSKEETSDAVPHCDTSSNWPNC